MVLAAVGLALLVEGPVVMDAQRQREPAALRGAAGKVEGVVRQGQDGLARLGELVEVDLPAVGEVEGCLFDVSPEVKETL